MLKKKRAEKCTKKRGARAKLLFCKSNLLSFWRSRYRLKVLTLTVDITGSLSNDDGHVNENGNNAIVLDWQNNNFARASRFFVHFFAVVARLEHESA